MHEKNNTKILQNTNKTKFNMPAGTSKIQFNANTDTAEIKFSTTAGTDASRPASRAAAFFLSVLLLFASLALLSGCGTDSNTADSGNTGGDSGNGSSEDLQTAVAVDPAALADDLQNGVPFQDQMTAVESDVFYLLYDLTSEDADEAVLITSTGATAEEIAVIHAAAEDKVETVKEAVKARVQAQREGFEDYVPEELAKLEKPVISIVGSYVILCVSDDNEKARDIIQESIIEN